MDFILVEIPKEYFYSSDTSQYIVLNGFDIIGSTDKIEFLKNTFGIELMEIKDEKNR